MNATTAALAADLALALGLTEVGTATAATGSSPRPIRPFRAEGMRDQDAQRRRKLVQRLLRPRIHRHAEGQRRQDGHQEVQQRDVGDHEGNHQRWDPDVQLEPDDRGSGLGGAERGAGATD